MRRRARRVAGGSGAALAVLAVLFLGSACGRGADPEDPDVAASESTAVPVESALPVDPAETGVLLGRVRVEGPLPHARSSSAAMPAGCSHGETFEPDPASEPVHGVDGGLGGAYVSVVRGWQGWSFPAPSAPEVRLEQLGCLFRPRLVAVRVGQAVLVGNQDAVTHNVHTYPRRSAARNVTQVAGGPDLRLEFERAEIVPLTCDLHPWMKAFVAVAEHPLFDCTQADGAFRIEGVPPGSYTVEVWHEVLGELRADVEVAPRAEVTVEFVYPAEQ